MDKRLKQMLDELAQGRSLDELAGPPSTDAELRAAYGDAPFEAAAGAALAPLPSELDEYRREVFEEVIMHFVTHHCFDICKLDDIATAVRQAEGLEPLTWPDKTPLQEALRPVLGVLHCAHYDKMKPAVRQGLPAAIFAYTGLNEATGTALLGSDRWFRVAKAFEDFAAPPTLTVADSTSEAVEADTARPTQRHGVRAYLSNLMGRR